MTTNTRIDLKVPFVEKDQAKVHGARWDQENRLSCRTRRLRIIAHEEAGRDGCLLRYIPRTNQPGPDGATNLTAGLR